VKGERIKGSYRDVKDGREMVAALDQACEAERRRKPPNGHADSVYTL